MKSELAYNYYKTQYEAENNIRDTYYKKIGILVFQTMLLLPLIMYLLQHYNLWDWSSTKGGVTSFLLISGIVDYLMAYIYILIVVYNCKHQATIDTKDIRKAELTSTEGEFVNTMKEQLIACCYTNHKRNGTRSKYYYKAQFCVAGALLEFVCVLLLNI